MNPQLARDTIERFEQMRKADRKPRVFSIGYEHLKPDELKQLVAALSATLIDVRSRPSGRVNRGFSKADLAALLGTQYEWHGRELGGFGAGPTVEGLKRLAADKRRIVLMCKEHEPATCHRYSMIAVPLLVAGVEMHHVYEDQVVTTTELKHAIEHDCEYEYEDLGDVIADLK